MVNPPDTVISLRVQESRGSANREGFDSSLQDGTRESVPGEKWI